MRERKLHIGDNVKVIKKGTQTGKIGTVTDPDWNGRVKLRMKKTGDVKSYLVHEVVLIREEYKNLHQKLLGFFFLDKLIEVKI